MFKFLRKYNKYILAVGGTLLLITFLIPFAFTNLLQGVGRGGATWATINDDRDNTTPDWQITTSPAAGDLVVMRLPVRKSWHHCGILIESGQVLHAYEGPSSAGRIVAQKPAALLRLFAEVAYAKWLH